MIKYNIYYKNNKLNKYPLDDNQLNKILEQKEFHKNKQFDNISINDINIIKTIIV